MAKVRQRHPLNKNFVYNQTYMTLHQLNIKIKIIHVIKAFFFSLLFIFSQPSSAALTHDQALIWKTLKSEHFNIHFHNNENDIAQKVIIIAENEFNRLQNEFNWIPEHAIEIVISDEKDIYPDETLTLPHKLHTVLYLSPPGQLEDFDNRLSQVITKKLANLIHIDKSAELPLSLKKVFGRHPLLFPNHYQPNWIKQGLVLYLESDEIGGTGEGQSSVYKMMMRMEVAKGLKSINQISVNTAAWPAKSIHHIYGYFFFQFLETRYGKKAIDSFIDNYSKNLIPFRINTTSTLTFNKSLDKLWLEYIDSLQETYDKQTKDIQRNQIIAGTKITDNGYYKFHAKPVDDINLLIAQYDGAYHSELILQNTNTDSSLFITEIEPDANIASHPQAGVIASQIEAYRNTNYFKDLYHIDIHSSEKKRLTRGDRYIRTIWHPDGEQLIALHSKLGKHTLVLLSHDGRLIDLLWEGVAGEYIGGLNWSPDGLSIAASVKRNNTSWQIEEFDINKRQWRKLTHTSDIEAQPQYSKDGKSIYFTADYMGVFNIRRLDLESKNITTITNVVGGAFSPEPGNNNDLYYIGYTDNGYDVFHLKQIIDLPIDTISRNIVKEQKSTSAQAIRYDTQEYSPYRYLLPKWWSPTLQIDSRSTKLGLFTTASDPLKIHSFDALLSFDLDSSTTSGEFNYQLDRWFPLIQLHIKDNSRKDFQHKTYQAEMLAPLISVSGKWYFGLSYALDEITEKNPDNSAQTQSSNNPNASIGIIFDSRRQYIRSNGISDGRLVSLVTETSNIANSDFDGRAIIGKWQEYITIKPEHVIGFRMIGGFGIDNPKNFQLGGYTSNELIDSKLASDISRKVTLYNERNYPFRGYKANTDQYNGKRIVLYDLEWRFPIKRIDQAWSKMPIIGVNQITGTLFSSIGSVWNEGLWPQQHQVSIGTELRAFSELFYFLPTEIRAGYAHGFAKEGEDQVYISFNSSF